MLLRYRTYLIRPVYRSCAHQPSWACIIFHWQRHPSPLPAMPVAVSPVFCSHLTLAHKACSGDSHFHGTHSIAVTPAFWSVTRSPDDYHPLMDTRILIRYPLTRRLSPADGEVHEMHGNARFGRNMPENIGLNAKVSPKTGINRPFGGWNRVRGSEDQ